MKNSQPLSAAKDLGGREGRVRPGVRAFHDASRAAATCGRSRRFEVARASSRQRSIHMCSIAETAPATKAAYSAQV